MLAVVGNVSLSVRSRHLDTLPWTSAMADNRSVVAANLADRYVSIGDNQNLHRKIVASLVAPHNDKSITEFGYPKSLAIKIA